MLIFGDPSPPEQRGMPFLSILFALAVPAAAADVPVIHRFDCAELPDHSRARACGLREIVYSTTFDEILEYATRQFGEDGWLPCYRCGD
jgi:hypothetical protein